MLAEDACTCAADEPGIWMLPRPVIVTEGCVGEGADGTVDFSCPRRENTDIFLLPTLFFSVKEYCMYTSILKL